MTTSPRSDVQTVADLVAYLLTQDQQSPVEIEVEAGFAAQVVDAYWALGGGKPDRLVLTAERVRR